MRKEIDVHIGEVKVAQHGEILKAILGSCVGIGFLWRERAICGLAHCLLPAAPSLTFDIGARYVDQAVASLIALLKIKSKDKHQIIVVVAGGGNMTQPGAKDPDKLVGALNLASAERELARLGLKPFQIDKGHFEGKTITIDSGNCTFQVESIPRMRGIK